MKPKITQIIKNNKKSKIIQIGDTKFKFKSVPYHKKNEFLLIFVKTEVENIFNIFY